jgi:hypothetical protein
MANLHNDILKYYFDAKLGVACFLYGFDDIFTHGDRSM